MRALAVAVTIAALAGCASGEDTSSPATTDSPTSFSWSPDESYAWGDCIVGELGGAIRSESKVRTAGAVCVVRMRPGLPEKPEWFGECAVTTFGWNNRADGLTFGTGLEECLGR